ncbi:MAG: hypothetical protein LBK99_10630 [Opitutaceae bacterium]|jgi:hypothetical protein|nr:hypothetical protein [Opitutaceae bacterium]
MKYTKKTVISVELTQEQYAKLRRIARQSHATPKMAMHMWTRLVLMTGTIVPVAKPEKLIAGPLLSLHRSVTNLCRDFDVDLTS